MFYTDVTTMTPERRFDYERRRDRFERRAKAKAASGQRGRTPVLGDLSMQDKIRLRLSEIRQLRERNAGKEPAKTLSTAAGVHALSFATRYIEGGRERFIEFVQLAVLNNHPAACAFYEVFLDLSTYQRDVVSFDDVCSAAGVRPSDLMACVVACAMELARDTGNLVASLMHPEVVRQAAKSGKRIGGDWANIGLEDRRMLFQHAGFIPVPKNTIVNVHASANAQAAAAAASEPSVPKFSDDLSAVARRASFEAPTPKFLEPADDDEAIPSQLQVPDAVLISPDE